MFNLNTTHFIRNVTGITIPKVVYQIMYFLLSLRTHHLWYVIMIETNIILYKLLCIPCNNFLYILSNISAEESLANNMKSIVQNVVIGVRCVGRINVMVLFCKNIDAVHLIRYTKYLKSTKKLVAKSWFLYSSKNLFFFFFFWKTHNILILMIRVSSLST